MSESSPERCELLAPAGDREAMRAAVANGADAVYFGLSDFNARRRAPNFTLEELPEVMRYLHAHNVRGYVALNTLIFSDELPEAARFAARIAEAGADAAIVQDLGLARLVQRLAPSLPVHASTQMTQTEARGIELLRSLGFDRVILARELSLRQVEQIRRATPIGLEVFVHGALCVSYSGQCLASQSLLGRSANRGLCAQVCRLPWTLIVDGRPRDLADRPYLLSTKDLAAADRVADLVRLGVVGLKIEGRLKDATYVAASTRVYREALDAARAGRPFAISREQELELAQGFSRGFTHGFLDGVNHRDLVEARSPKSRGARVGSVVGKTAHGVVVRLSAIAFVPSQSAIRNSQSAMPLKPGDGVVFDAGRPDAQEQGGRIYSVRPTDPQAIVEDATRSPSRPPPETGIGPSAARRTKGVPPARRPSGGRGHVPAGDELVEITFGRDDVNLAAVPVGAAVWKTDDPAIRRRLEQTYARDEVVRRSPLHLRVFAQVGGKLRIAAADDAGRQTEAAWDRTLEKADKHPLTLDLVREQCGRLGDTPFELASVEIITEAGPASVSPVMVPKSVLNDLRRRAVDALLALREASFRHALADPEVLERLRSEAAEEQGHSLAGSPSDLESGICNPRLSVLVRDLPQLDAVLAWSAQAANAEARPALVYGDFASVEDCREATARARGAGMPIALATPRVVKPGEDGLLERILDAGPDAVLVRNLGAVGFFRERRPGLPLVGDFSLNVANELTAAALGEMGLVRLTPSIDLDRPALAAMLARISPALFEVVIHQHVPLFHMDHCPAAARLSDARDAATCGAPCRKHRLELRDRNGVDHPLWTDAACRTTVFRAGASSAARHLPEMIRQGVRHFRVELLREAAEETPALLRCYARALAAGNKG